MSRQQLRTYVTASLGVFFVALFAPAASATIMLNNGLINPINSLSEDIEVSNGPGDSSTIANLMVGADIAVDGDDRSIGLLQDSVLLFSGGSTQGDVVAEGNSVAFLQGTSTVSGNLVLEGSSELQFSDDSLVKGDVELDDGATANFSGGTVEGEIAAAGNAMATFTGGTFEDDIVAEDNAVIVFSEGTAERDLEAEADTMVDISGGVIEGTVEVVENAKLTITGGEFPNVFSDGEEILAAGPGVEANITNAVFGIAGEADDGRIAAAQSATVHVSGIAIAGQPEAMAPTATLAAILGGELSASNIAFGDLHLVAESGGTLNIDDITADAATLSMLGGGTTNLDGGTADSLEVTADLASTLNLRGGDFGNIEAALFSNSVLRIFGDSFTFLGFPLESLPPEGYIPETGELLAIGGTLAGVLVDGTPFSMSFTRQFSPPAQAARIFLVPEPGAMALALLATVGVSSSRRWGRGQR